MKLVIGIAGKKRAGKDTVLGCIQHWMGMNTIVRVAFADKLKQEIAKACGVTVQHIDSNKELFRPILQWWGTDFRRKYYGDDYWIKQWQKVVDYMQGDMPDCIVVAPDVRFKNEIAAIQKNGGFVINVINPRNFDNDTHGSENDLSDVMFHHTIINDGTIPELGHKVKAVLQSNNLIK